MIRLILLDFKTTGFEGMEWTQIFRHKFQWQIFKAVSSPFVALTKIDLSLSPCASINSRNAKKITHMNV